MRRTSGWAVALLAAGAAAAGVTWADDPEPPGRGPAAPAPLIAPKVDPKVATLIADLGSDDYRTREKAGRDLAAFGEKALPGMRAALVAADSPEVRQRLAALVRRMDTDRLVAPKRVTLSAKDKRAKDVIDEIAKQTGYKIDYQGNRGGGEAEPRGTFEFDNTPFWVAIDQVAAAAGCAVLADHDDETVRVYNQDQHNPHVAYAGPFRFLATNINSNKSVQLSGLSRRNGGQYRHENLSLSFQVQSEPKNPMLGVTQAEVVSATDEAGASLVLPKDPNNRSHYYENRGNRGHNMYGNLNLNRSGSASAATIKSLKAKIGVILLAGTVPDVVVPDPLKLKNKSFVGRTVEVDFNSLVEDANQKGHYTLDVTLRKAGVVDPNDPNQDYNWSNSVWQKVELVDAAGNRYRPNGLNSINNNGAAVQVTIPFAPSDPRTGRPLKLGPPVKMVVSEWLSVTHEVTFEFKDVPLP